MIHCTATPQYTTVESIRNYWKYTLGWANPGYHFIVDALGEVTVLLPITEVANGVKGHNQDSIHISYIGGVDEESRPLDNRTGSQKKVLAAVVKTLKQCFPNAEIKGHRDFEGVNKACPSFDAKEWAKELFDND